VIEARVQHSPIVRREFAAIARPHTVFLPLDRELAVFQPAGLVRREREALGFVVTGLLNKQVGLSARSP
jgi:hypothetical protein